MDHAAHLAEGERADELYYDAQRLPEAHLTTAEGIRNWWTLDADLDSKIGGTGEFCFMTVKSVTKVKVDELKPPVHVV